jgi:hypothetical protein
MQYVTDFLGVSFVVLTLLLDLCSGQYCSRFGGILCFHIQCRSEYGECVLLYRSTYGLVQQIHEGRVEPGALGRLQDPIWMGVPSALQRRLKTEIRGTRQNWALSSGTLCVAEANQKLWIHFDDAELPTIPAESSVKPQK